MSFKTKFLISTSAIKTINTKTKDSAISSAIKWLLVNPMMATQVTAVKITNAAESIEVAELRPSSRGFEIHLLESPLFRDTMSRTYVDVTDCATDRDQLVKQLSVGDIVTINRGMHHHTVRARVLKIRHASEDNPSKMLVATCFKGGGVFYAEGGFIRDLIHYPMTDAEIERMASNYGI